MLGNSRRAMRSLMHCPMKAQGRHFPIAQAALDEI
jgi:hypothetical protein